VFWLYKILEYSQKTKIYDMVILNGCQFFGETGSKNGGSGGIRTSDQGLMSLSKVPDKK
jgi:hypothetical protein